MRQVVEIFVLLLRALSPLVARPWAIVVVTSLFALAGFFLARGIWRRKYWVLLALPVWLVGAIAAFCLGLLPGADWWFETRWVRQVTGVAFCLGDPVLFYDSERSFTNDGVSYYVFRLPEGVAGNFRDPWEDHDLYPEKPAFREAWGVGCWRFGPPVLEDQECIAFALDWAPDDAPDARRIVELARRCLRKRSTWYAYFRNPPDGRLRDIDLFIIDAEDRLFIVINAQT